MNVQNRMAQWITCAEALRARPYHVVCSYGFEVGRPRLHTLWRGFQRVWSVGMLSAPIADTFHGRRRMPHLELGAIEMPYTNTVIYVMSGTGNSRRVAEWMAEQAREKGSDARVVPIEKGRPAEETADAQDSLIGIVSPTHGFITPWLVLKFVWRLPRQRFTNVFCAATRAGMKFGSLFTPGISGAATFLTALILWFKGYNVRGAVSVDMPSNWFSLHPIQSEHSHRAIIERGRKKTAGFMEQILAGRRVWLTWNNLWEIIWAVCCLPISIAYLFAGRFFLAKLFFANENCNGCGICAKNCAVGGIRMLGRQDPRPFWRYSCESCMRCAAFCPQDAVEAGHSWGVILYFITAAPIAVYLVSMLETFIPATARFNDWWLGEILRLLYFYPAIFLSYMVFYALTQITVVNRFFALTTLTHFWGRYREPDTKLRHLTESPEPRNKESLS